MPSRIFVSQHPPFRTRNYQAFTEFERTGPASACRSGALRSRESRADSLSRKTRYPRMWRPDSEWIVGYPEVIAKYPLVEVGDLATEVQGSAVSGVGRGSRLRQQSDLNGVALDASQHPAEHKVMEREHRVPIDQTEQPAGSEQSCLVEDALAFVTWFYSEVEQRFTR
jgi:hypothetical protein